MNRDQLFDAIHHRANVLGLAGRDLDVKMNVLEIAPCRRPCEELVECWNLRVDLLEAHRFDAVAVMLSKIVEIELANRPTPHRAQARSERSAADTRLESALARECNCITWAPVVPENDLTVPRKAQIDFDCSALE